MVDIAEYKSTPIGSLITLPEKEASRYIDSLSSLPFAIINILNSDKTGAFIIGLLKTHNLNTTFAPLVALNLTRIGFGEKTFAQLPAILSTELKISNDKAQKMAQEIERDVFGPVRAQLDEFLRKQKHPTSPSGLRGARETTSKVSSTMQNVLNLKELPARKPQASLPPRPAQKDLPVRKP